MVGATDKVLRKTVPFGDAHDHVTADTNTETQVVDSDSETEMINLDLETQEVNLACETQLIGDPDCFDTQLLDHTDDEVAADSDDEEVADSDDGETDRTEELENDGKLSDDSLSRGATQFFGKVNGSVRSSEVLIKEQQSPRTLGRFTSVRTAAFRASGLAARNACPKVATNSEFRSVLTNRHSSDQRTMGNKKTECYVGEEVYQLRHGKTTGNRTVRRLFGDDDSPSDPEGKSQNVVVPLGYVDSQEPAEASQANALSFVQRFINDNCLEFEDELDHRKSSAEKLKDCWSARSLQMLAKKAGNRSGSKDTGIFDWDDNREDEGGGDILCRRKEELFGTASGGRKSSTVPTKSQGKRNGCGKRNELENSVDKISTLSDLELVGCNNLENGEKVTVAGMKRKKIPVNKLKRRLTGNDDEVFDVGPDTQIAAEAIEALNCGDRNNLGVDNGSHQDVQDKNKTSQIEIVRCDSGVKRRSKRIKSTDYHESLKRGTKRARPAAVNSPQKKRRGISKRVQADTPNKPESCKSDEKSYPKNKASDSKFSTKSNKDRMILLSSHSKPRRSNRNLQSQPYRSSNFCDCAVDTPVKFKTPVNNDASPICMGDEYLKQSCNNPSKSFSSREILHLTAAQPMVELKSPRKRRDLGSVHVLFSQHLDVHVTKHQRKIMARLGISEASCIKKATHFVADKFVRTRNMLEAIASGKHVVTPLWLDSIGQVKIFIDEEAYLLRDTKKEKKFGFSMPYSLEHARQHPLLQGRRVFITPNTKPGKQTIRTLVKAVHGQAVERLGRSAIKDDKLADSLLVLSCEEDFSICVQFLEKGMEVYSSELLLNGIVTQKLEYERHRLFADYVKKTRSTIWLRNNQGAFCPVTSKK